MMMKSVSLSISFTNRTCSETSLDQKHVTHHMEEQIFMSHIKICKIGNPERYRIEQDISEAEQIFKHCQPILLTNLKNQPIVKSMLPPYAGVHLNCW